MAGKKSSKSEFRRPNVYTPFYRWFGDERTREVDETRALYERVRGAHLATRWSNEDRIGEVGGKILREVSRSLDAPLPKPVVDALADTVIELLMLEAQVFMTPTIDWSTANFSASEFVELRQFLRRQEHFLANEERVSTLLTDTLVLIFSSILSALPALPEASRFRVPLHAFLADPNDVVNRTIGTFLAEHRIEAGLFATLSEIMYTNVCVVSGVEPNSEPTRPLLTADKSPLRDRELIDAYLSETPLVQLLTCPVPFGLTQHKAHHWAIYGRTGHGKTQLLQTLILDHLCEPEPQAMIVIDSQGKEGMLKKIERLDIFARDPDRLLVIDAQADPSPALNMFDVPKLDEAAEIEIIDLYNYIFSAIDADLTSRQSTAFSYIVRLMLAHPGATILTLLELMEEKVKTAQQSKFWPTIATLDPVAQGYFQNRFFTAATNQTKEQLAVRLYGILRIKAIGRMFTATQNKLDLYAAMQEKKTVLISTAGLGEASSLFGRYMIALAMRAAFQRGGLPEHKRHAVLLFVDEAFDVMDSNINRILIQARKFGLFIRFATQQYDQIAHDIRAAAAANTEVKLAGGLSAADCRTLAPDMRTSSDFLMSTTRVDRSHTEFACFVQNVTPSALKLEVPFGALENAPRMDDATYEALARMHRERFGAGSTVPAPRQEPQPAPSSTPPPPTASAPSLVTLPHNIDVVLPDFQLTIPALLDSGAAMSCLPANNLRVENGVAFFTLLGRELSATVIRTATLVGFTGKPEEGPVVALRLTIAQFTAEEQFALIPGSSILVGRSFLSGRILVDPTEPAKW